MIRLMGTTLGPRGLRPTDRSRVQLIKDFIRKHEVDLLGAYEVGVPWHKVGKHLHPQEIFRNDRPLRTQTAHNKFDNGHNGFQWGGTMLLANDVITTRLTEKGKDPKGLGRWSWMLFHGKHGIKTRFISAYCPTPSPKGRLDSVYCQQQRRLRYKHKTDDCPRKVFTNDLQHFLAGCRHRQERIVLFIDANQDIRNSPLATALAELDIHEAITNHHPTQPPPATYKYGKTCIDGIYLSPELIPHKAGFLAITTEVGDHRQSYIDIPFQELLGDDVLRVERPTARRLTTKNPKVLKKYIRLLTHFLHKKKIKERLQAAKRDNKDHTTLPRTQHHRMEKIDRDITEGAKYAEKRCRKLRMGDLDFSPEAIKARDTKYLWKLVQQRLEGKTRSKHRIRRLARKLNIKAPMRVTLEEAISHRQQASQQYRIIKPIAGTLRQEFLHDRQTDPSCSEEERKRAQQALNTERARTASRQIRRIKGKINGGAIKEIEIPPPPNHHGPPQLIQKREQVIQGIMDMVKTRYHLIDSSPLMEATTLNALGLLADTPTAQAILEGTHCGTIHPDANICAFLNLINHKGPSPPISHSITTTDFQNYWKKAKEDTSSSLSGRHFGHYKAATKSEELSEIYTDLCNLTYAKGYPLQRWKAGLTVMLEKEPGVINVDKLRAILLLEADFNFLNKLFFGSRMIHRAHKDHLIPPETFGGVKDRNPHQLALVRKCAIDFSTIMHRTLAVASTDAAQCYDRIQHTAASLSCQAWGVPKILLTTLLTTIQHMQIHLRTAHGDTDHPIPNDPANPFQGILQGNGAGPAVWLAISAFLVLYIHHRTGGSRLSTPISGAETNIAGVLFVDDTDLMVLASPTDTTQTVISKLQAMVNAWQDGLRATGGALKPKKCAWAIKTFLPRQGRLYLSPDSRTQGTLTIAHNNQRLPIRRQKPSEAVKAVGFIQSLDGSMKAQIQSITSKADTWAHQIRSNHLDRRLAWYAIRSTIWPSLCFPLPVCTITWDQGDQIVKKLYKSLLPALGANRNFPKIWRHAPVDFMGLDLPHPYVEQGIGQICSLLTMGASKTLPGFALRMQLEAAQLTIGCDEDFLLADFDRWGHLLHSSTLAYSMWDFQRRHDIRTFLETPLCPPIQRDNDTTIMSLFAHLDYLTPEQLYSLNQCRIAKQVYYLSDLTTGDGKHLLLEYTTPHPYNRPPRTSSWEWPTAKPTRDDWSLWKSSLSQIFPHHRLPPDYQLGRWVTEPHIPHTLFYDKDQHHLWEKQQDTWKRYDRSSSSLRPRYRLHSSHQSSPSTPMEPATAKRISHNSLSFTGSAPPPPQVSTPISISETIATFGEARWPLNTAIFPEEGKPIADAIQQGTAIGVSDGSYKPGKNRKLSAAAWILQDLHTGQVTYGVVRTSGTTTENNAYRAELQGFHTMLMGVTTICTLYHITTGSIVLGMDNEAGVLQCMETMEEPPANTKHVDLIRACRRIINSLPIQVHLEHIDGHADAIVGRTLNPMECLNVAADSMAKEHLDQLCHLATTNQLQPCPPTIYMEGTRIYIQNTKITCKPGEHLRQAVFYEAMREYLDERNLLPATAFPLVDWNAIRKAAQQSAPLFRLWASKNASGQCAVGKMMKKWNFWEEERCPLCAAMVEDARHVPMCPAAPIRQTYAVGVTKFQEKLQSLQTHPDIITCLTKGIERRGASFSSHSKPWIATAATEQETIGWAATIEGRISSLWTDLQSSHYEKIRSRRSPEAWAAHVVEALWTLSHSLWVKRCEIVKDMERTAAFQSNLCSLNNQITHKYANYNPRNYDVNDRYLFTDKTLQQRLATPISTKETWLQAVAWAEELAHEASANENTQMRLTLQHWLSSNND